MSDEENLKALRLAIQNFQRNMFNAGLTVCATAKPSKNQNKYLEWNGTIITLVHLNEEYEPRTSYIPSLSQNELLFVIPLLKPLYEEAKKNYNEKIDTLVNSTLEVNKITELCFGKGSVK